MPKSASFLVIGDIHNIWSPADASFVTSGDHDLSMFVGDLGDEDVDMVETIANIDARKLVILGNHDAWRSFSEKHVTDNLRRSLQILGDDHFAYGRHEWYEGGMSIIGARPFSWGGRSLRSPEVYADLYGVRDHEESAQRIVEAARRAEHRQILILAHNGPTGLSMETHDIWGKDFGKSPRGDWGDEDLEIAIDRIKGLGLRVPLVVAGHMHHKLITPRGAYRTRFLRHGGTIYVNSAVVPRTKKLKNGVSVSYFLRITCSGGKVERFEELWVDQSGKVRKTTTPRIMEEVS